MKPIIQSILDDDLYKVSMGNAILELFPDAIASYKFKNRGSQRFNSSFLQELRNQIDYMSNIKLTEDEYSWLINKNPFLKIYYADFLRNYRYNPDEVKCSLDKENNLELDINGPWYRTVLWEVKLMAIISELYFKIIDTDWSMENIKGCKNIEEYANNEAIKLHKNSCLFVDYGTRRRRNFLTQFYVNKVFSKFHYINSCMGTSNMYLAKLYDMKAIGSVGHEWIQGMQALESINHCNYYAMHNWTKCFNTLLGIALTDTLTVDMFLDNFSHRLAMLHTGVRHDSGNPFVFTDKVIAHYKKLGIDPMSKFIIFSDSLNSEKAITIRKYCDKKIKCCFGIGTHFTGSGFLKDNGEDSNPLNMVIKLWSIDGFPVVKLSDVEGKENGDPKMVNMVKDIVRMQLNLKC